jgi:hypothetical protein
MTRANSTCPFTSGSRDSFQAPASGSYALAHVGRKPSYAQTSPSQHFPPSILKVKLTKLKGKTNQNISILMLVPNHVDEALAVTVWVAVVAPSAEQTRIRALVRRLHLRPTT